MSKRTTATLWAQDGRIFIRTDYDADFVDAFKKMVPPKHRSWKPKPEKVWTCDPAYLDQLHALCEKYFHDVSVMESNGNGEASDVDGANPYELFLRHCPNDYLKKIHRAIVAAVHPDKGGSQEAAADVNTAWKVIREERGI